MEEGVDANSNGKWRKGREMAPECGMLYWLWVKDLGPWQQETIETTFFWALKLFKHFDGITNPKFTVVFFYNLAMRESS